MNEKANDLTESLGDIAVCCENIIIREGERCMQGIFVRYFVTEDDNATGERVGGYGSTDH